MDVPHCANSLSHGTHENSPAIHCRDNNSRMPESHRDGRRSLIMKHLLTPIVCAAVLAWALPLNACPGPNIDVGYFASGARSEMAADLKDSGNRHDLLARRGGGRGQGKGGGSGSGQCDGSGSDRGQGKGYSAKDGTGTGECPRDGSGYGAGSGSGSGDGSGKNNGSGAQGNRDCQ